jgi:signal transduction histidine kinase
MVRRLLVWVFLFSFDVLVPDIMRAILGPIPFYAILAVLLSTLFIMLLWFEESELIWDIRELVFYDVMLQWLGLALYLTGINNGIYVILLNANELLKWARLLWTIRSADGSKLMTWPVFGIIGYIRRRKSGEQPIRFGNLLRHEKQVYLLISSLLIVSIGIHLLRIPFLVSYSAFILLWVITLFYNHFMNYLNEQNAAHIATVKALAVQKATAQANAALVAASIQREHMLRELAQKNDELREANKQREAMLEDLGRRNEILRDASHDLAQPLMGISYYARKLTESQTLEEQDVFGDKLLTAVAGLGNLIDDTIHNAKITTKLEAPQLAPVAIEHLADQLWAQYLNAAHRKGIGFTLYKGTLSLPVDPQDPKRGHRSALDFHIATDENIVWRIISNLVINAINHTEQGRILVAFRRRGTQCWIEVRDSGSGIEHANGPDWEANFQHFAESIKRRYGTFKKGAGHGLGINNVKQLCNTIDTQMLLYSQPGRGSIFRFVVPLICPLDGHADHNLTEPVVTLA